MSLAEDLQSVLAGAAAALRSEGTDDTAEMAEQAAAILGAHAAAGPLELAEYAAVHLVDHLLRGSAAAGAINSLPAVTLPEPPAPAKPASKLKPL